MATLEQELQRRAAAAAPLPAGRSPIPMGPVATPGAPALFNPVGGGGGTMISPELGRVRAPAQAPAQAPAGVVLPGTQPMPAVRSVIERPAPTVNPAIRGPIAATPPIDPAVTQRLGQMQGPPTTAIGATPAAAPATQPVRPPNLTGAGATPGTNPGASLAGQAPQGNLMEKAQRAARSFGNTAKDMGTAAAGKVADAGGKVGAAAAGAASAVKPIATGLGKAGVSAIGGQIAAEGVGQAMTVRDWVDALEAGLRTTSGAALVAAPFAGPAALPAGLYGGVVGGGLKVADYMGMTEQAKDALRAMLGMASPNAKPPQPNSPEAQKLISQIPAERTALQMPDFKNVQSGASSTTQPAAAAPKPASGPVSKAAAKAQQPAQQKDTAGLDALIAQQSAKYPTTEAAAPATLDQTGQAPEGRMISLYGYGGNPTGDPVQQFRALELPPMEGEVPQTPVEILRGGPGGISRTMQSANPDGSYTEKFAGMPELGGMDTTALAKFVTDAAASGNPGAMKAAEQALNMILGRESTAQKDTQSQRSLQGDLARAGATVTAAQAGAGAERYKADQMVEASKIRGSGPLKLKQKVKDQLGNEREVTFYIDPETREVIGQDALAGMGVGQSPAPAANQKQPVRLNPAQVQAEWERALKSGLTNDERGRTEFVKRMNQSGYFW